MSAEKAAGTRHLQTLELRIVSCMWWAFSWGLSKEVVSVGLVLASCFLSSTSTIRDSLPCVLGELKTALVKEVTCLLPSLKTTFPRILCQLASGWGEPMGGGLVATEGEEIGKSQGISLPPHPTWGDFSSRALWPQLSAHSDPSSRALVTRPLSLQPCCGCHL